MTTPRTTHYYYLSEEGKKITYYAEQLSKVPEGYIFCGLSDLPVKGAAGYYAKNQPGYSLINGDEEVKKETQDVEDEPADFPAY